MHELAICQSLFDQAQRIAAQNHTHKCSQNKKRDIETIAVTLGPLCGVEVPLLQRAFDIARVAAGFPSALLEIEVLPIRVRCLLCEAESEVIINKLLCTSCGSWRVKVVQGEDMILKSIVLARQTPEMEIDKVGENYV